MHLKLTPKLLIVNIGIILILISILLALNYNSNKGLLSRVMNGIDVKVMDVLAVELASYYEENQSWDGLINNTQDWSHIVDKHFFQVFFAYADIENLPPIQGPPDHDNSPAPANPPCDPPFGTFLQRLSLLDQNKDTLIAPELLEREVYEKAIKLEGKTVGWLSVGKINVDVIPLAEHFFREQLAISVWSTIIGGLLAVFASIALSRQITAPLKKLTRGAKEIAKRNFEHEISVNTKDELNDLATSFNFLSKELHRFENRQKQWLMDISHELRTPLTILTGEISAICDNVTKYDLSAIKSLQEEVFQIKRLVDDLHDLSTLDQVDFTINKENIDLCSTVEFTLKRYHDLYRENQIDLQQTLPELPIYVYGDGDRLAQVVRNLLENCLRYIDRPGLVRVALTKQGDHAQLTVEDSGPGVSPEAQSKLFDRLYRADSSRNRDSGGAGLGLTICKKIITAHRGEISAINGELGGLSIHILIPMLK